MSDGTGVGARLRAARRALGFTIDNMADTTGLSRSYISKVERDEASPSLKTLLTLCDAFGIDLGSLFAKPYTRHIRVGEQPMVSRVVPGKLIEHIMTPYGHEPVQILHAVLGPNVSSGDELFSLQVESETLFVIRGTVAMVFATETIEVTEGEALTFAGQEPHGWFNPSTDEEADIIWVIAPAPWAPKSKLTNS